MKKRMFRMLCVVLTLALLAPNVFAATPTPEVPLADEATVTRVKNEIATGEITDMEDVFLVAYQHLGADLEEEGMTAYINEDGTLGFTQILNSKQTRSGSTEQELAVTSIAFLNADGTKSIVDITTLTGYASGSLSGIPVYVTHTAYILKMATVDGILDYDYKMNYMSTTINYNTTSFVPTKLVQSYLGRQRDDVLEETASKTTNYPSNGTHDFSPNNASWFDSGDGQPGGGIGGTATLYISNINTPIEVSVWFSLFYSAFL